jgi:hypothetical protein
MGENKKWWLIPFLVVFLLLGAVIVASSTSIGPFLYSFF